MRAVPLASRRPISGRPVCPGPLCAGPCTAPGLRRTLSGDRPPSAGGVSGCRLESPAVGSACVAGVGTRPAVMGSGHGLGSRAGSRSPARARIAVSGDGQVTGPGHRLGSQARPVLSDPLFGLDLTGTYLVLGPCPDCGHRPRARLVPTRIPTPLTTGRRPGSGRWAIVVPRSRRPRLPPPRSDHRSTHSESRRLRLRTRHRGTPNAPFGEPHRPGLVDRHRVVPDLVGLGSLRLACGVAASLLPTGGLLIFLASAWTSRRRGGR
ncbi:hypothetical protein FHR81_000778 [Actinoalloteichus hoggarensis]|uniref:Uncharacterized protein n=1 Tax=Actinoalloteichus hoggarensis TaxID=1470176 RepID=A0A221W191_9PSEU|nr:hypothetical protein AHOG_09500 [Actinoalloteichus hoggarensis]MBB5919749.1 hypothetical protein [Actinoalloteichus hoggarensis]